MPKIRPTPACQAPDRPFFTLKNTQKETKQKIKEAYFWLQQKKKPLTEIELLDLTLGAVSKTDLTHQLALLVKCTDSHTTGHLSQFLKV